MLKFSKCRVTALLSLVFFVVLGSSCVNEEYDMSGDNLNLEVTPFQEGLAIPFGETEQIKLTELLKDVDTNILNAGKNEVYSISFSDSLDMTEELSSLTDIIEIPDVDFSQKVSFQLNDVDVSDVKVAAQDYSFEHDLSASVSVPEINVPSVGTNVEVAAGLEKYKPAKEDLEIHFKPNEDGAKIDRIERDIKIVSLAPELDVQEPYRNDIPVPVGDSPYSELIQTHNEFDVDNASVHVEVVLPDGVKGVEDIVLHEGAKVNITMEITGGFIESGEVVPDVNLHLENLFHIDEGHYDGILNLKNDLVLSEENGYKASKTYGIESLAIESSDWEGNRLNKDLLVSADGDLIFNDLMTTTNRLHNLIVAETPEVHLTFYVEFANLLIDDIVMEIDPVTVSQENTVTMNVGGIAVPEEITEIKNVKFTENSVLDIDVAARNLDKVNGLDLVLETLSISFPKELDVEGADAANCVTVKNVNLAQGVSRQVRINGIDLPHPENGKIDFTGDIEVRAVAKAGGKIHSASLPSTAENDVKVLVDVESNLEVADYQVMMSGYDYELDIKGEEIIVELPDDLADLDEIIVYPEGSPAITVDMDFPEMALEIAPSAEGLRISFPQMLKFKDLAPSYNYDIATNSITFLGSLPAGEIVLPIEKLVLVPEKDETDGKWYARGLVDIKGGVSLASGLLSKAEVESISAPGKKISVVAHVPELVPATLALDSFETSIREEVALDIMSAEDVPAELVALGVVELKEETFINISLDASDLPELGSASLTVDLDVDIPDMIKVTDTDEDGNLKLSGKLENGMIRIDPVKVEALDLTGVDLKNGISDVVVIDGTVKLADAALDVDEWLKKDLQVEFNAGIKNIEIARLTGKVDYAVDPVVETVDLGDVADFFGESGAEATLDFYHAHLAVEVATNLGVPVEAEVELLPYYDGAVDKTRAVSATLMLNPSESSDIKTVTRYWLANDNDRCPAGYAFVEADVLGILKQIPEKLELRLKACTDSEKEFVLEPEPSDDYTLKANYLFELPLEFGEEFEVAYKTVVPDLPEIVGSLLSKGNKVMIAGEVQNSLPLALDLQLNFLDSNGEVVPCAEGCGVQKISPCGLDGSAGRTDLEVVLALKDGINVSDITSLELVFNASSDGVVGVPVTKDAYLQAILQVVLPEGVTVDLSEILNNEEK